ncbi:MAG TPA: LPS export ABC transporter periplasmic protein LptC [Candidatus Acidoferrales bacterium]|nr:LPS export ABC transporter periplasmic protein LptC [Candidatus Acidoferrales bacterium]
MRRLALVVLALGMAACARSSPGPTAPPSGARANGPVYHISAQGTTNHPVTITNITNGQVEYTLQAATVVYSTSLAQGTFHQNLLHFFKGGRQRLTVTAPVATVDENTHDVNLSGGVVARTTAGDTLASDSMSYDEKTRLLTAVGDVVATDPSGYKLTGRRAIADLDLQQIQLFGTGPEEAAKP